MRCPVCENIGLDHQSIQPGIEAKTCPHCDGRWISSSAYWKWRETLTQPIPNLSVDQAIGRDDPGDDSDAGKLCPSEGAFLIRHRVGHGLDFYIDRCGRCGGVWLDVGEWESLRARGLHDDLHLVFTSAWQAEVHRQRRASADEKLLLKILGQSDLQKAKNIRKWLESHPQASVIQAVLGGGFGV